MKSHGFTVVEMLTVVAIAGALTAVALPTYNTYVARGRQMEAKSTLAKIYTAEKLFYAEQGSYTACLRQIGALTDPEPKRHYAIGFSSYTRGYNQCGKSGAATGTLSCGAYDWGPPAGPAPFPLTDVCVDADTFLPANVKVFNGISVPASANLGSVSADISATTMVARAAGNVTSRSNYDRWSIDAQKTLSNTSPGAW